MIVSAIVAIAKNNVIGKDNQIPWYLPADLKYFKKTTLHHAIIMGRNCYESIGRPLPKRTNIIVTRNPFYAVSGCVVTHSIEEALQYARAQGETEAFIIGGGQIYNQRRDLWDRLYLTVVDVAPEGDVFWTPIEPSEWELKSTEAYAANGKNEFAYQFRVYDRK